MMISGTGNLVRENAGGELWVIALIAVASAVVATLSFYQPFLWTTTVLLALTLSAFLRFDFFVYGSVFLLPWYPLLDLPVQDIFPWLRFVLFVGVGLRIHRRHGSIRDWLFGGRIKQAMALFAGIAVASVPLSSTPANLPSYRSLVLLLSYVATFFAIDGWLESRTQLLVVLKLLLVSTIAVALFGFCQAMEGGYTSLYFHIYPIEKDAIVPWEGRITSLLFQFNSTAGYLNLVIPTAIACAVLAQDRVLKILGFTCACFAAVAVFLTQSRGGLLALVGVVIIALWLLVPRRLTRIKMVAASALLCLLLLPSLMNRFERLQAVDDATELSRLAVWQAAGMMFLEHPVLGVGYGNYRSLYGDLAPDRLLSRVEAHSLYLQLLAETGLVGFCGFAFFLWTSFFFSLQSFRTHDSLSRIVAFGACGAIVATLIHGAVDYFFNASPQFGALFWLVLGLGSWAAASGRSRVTSKAVTL